MASGGTGQKAEDRQAVSVPLEHLLLLRTPHSQSSVSMARPAQGTASQTFIFCQGVSVPASMILKPSGLD